jgi:hypothetical protein
MGNSKENKPVENIQDYVLDTSPEHVRELEDEARMRDAHGPSTVSEDNSN